MIDGDTDHIHARRGHGVTDHDGCGHHAATGSPETATDAAPASYLSKSKKAAPSKPRGTIFTCPMHPEIRQVGPGSCPICGMALEPETVTAEAAPNPELADMSRRFWIGLALTLPVFALEMGGEIPALLPARARFAPPLDLLQLRPRDAGRPLGGLAVLRAWLGLDRPSQPEHVQPDRARHGRGLHLQPRRDLDARIFSRRIPRNGWHGRRLLRGLPAVITVLVLLGQVLELRAREQTGGAIRALLNLAPKTARRLRPQARTKTSRLQRSRWATSCAFGPATACQSTAR